MFQNEEFKKYYYFYGIKSYFLLKVRSMLLYRLSCTVCLTMAYF